MLRKYTITGILLLQLFFQYAFAQNDTITFSLVNGPDGKATDKITSICQDQHGYMWFGGGGARTLYRYDGSRWIRYGMDNANPNALKATFLEKVYADDRGMIWVGGNGLDQLNPVTGIFKHYQHVENDPGSLCSNDVHAILKDHQGRLWVGTTHGLDRLDEKTDRFIHYHHDPGNPQSLSSNSVWTIYEDKKEVIWIGTGDPFSNELEDGGLNRLDTGYRFTRFLHDPGNPHSLSNNKVRSIFEDSRGVFWIGTGRNGLHIMDREKGSFERQEYYPGNPGMINRSAGKQDNWKYIHEQVTFICEDNAGGIWTGSMWSGIKRYDAGTKKFTIYKSGNGYPDSSGWTGYISRDGVLWIGTEDSYLLFKGRPFPRPINSIYTGSPTHDFLEDKKGILWVSTDKGLLQYDQQKKLIQQFSQEHSNPAKLFKDNVTSLKPAGSDTIWYGTLSSGVGIFNTNTRQFSKFPLGFAFSSAESAAIWDISKDKLGTIWFATGDGAVGYLPQDGSMKRYQHDGKDSGSILGNRISCILEDRSGALWIADAGGGGIEGIEGVNRLNKGADHFRHYLEGYPCAFLYEDRAGRIWACTRKGLYWYNNKIDKFSPFFDPESSFNLDWIFSLVEDKEKNLWFTTSSVLGKINPDRKGYTVFGKNYGIHPGSLSPKSAFRTEKGQLLFGHKQGFFAFYPDEMRAGPDLNIQVTDFYINDIPITPGKESALLKPIEETSAIELSYNQKNIAFNFRVTDYSIEPGDIKYYTMLEGYDNTWREALQGKSFYYNLSPARYAYKIKAFNHEGLKGEKTISILVNSPWWKTWWAYSFYILMLGMILLAFDRVQKQRIVRKEREKSQQFELAQAKEIEKAYHELKAAQAQLIQSEKMASLGELTAGIAHEIQNPLNFVNNFSEVNMELEIELKTELKKTNLPAQEKKDLMVFLDDIMQNQAKINEHGHRADAIVKSMLQHSRTSSGQKEPTDINALADEYLRLAYHGMRAKNKSLSVGEADFNAILQTDYDPGIGKINIIPQDIGRILLNLYNNAFYAIKEKKKISGNLYQPKVIVTTRLTGAISERQGILPSESIISRTGRDKLHPQSVIIIVHDNGMGIPEKVREKIFQPFFTTKPTGQGTGLGLSLSYDIIKAHHGEISVVSKEGEWTEISIRLPAI